MTELHFVGYNGYHQFPNNEEDHPKVITSWTTILLEGKLRACTHRFVLLETEKLLKIYGLFGNDVKILQELDKPAKTDTFGSCDEFILASEKTNIWKCSCTDLSWTKLILSFVYEEEKSVWEEAENSIVKFSFQYNNFDVILLLSNGSVWILYAGDSLKLLYPYDIDKAVDISSGLEHSLILTESGCVLTLGNGSRGQLGHGDLDPISQPAQVAALQGLKVTRIATGGWHSCALTDSGDLYAWGWNNCGQLSVFEDGKEIGLTALPVLVDVGTQPDVKVVEVACGRRHTVVRLENGDLYATGWNKYRQLGVETPLEKVSKFTKCDVRKGKNVEMNCGPWYTVLLEGSSK